MSSIAYRPSIDGLRAIAVIAVLLFHLNPAWLPGGFIGVDIFFVISGYLITLILLNENRQGRFSFGRFYQRRIARIFPVFFAVSVATLVAALFIYTEVDIAFTGLNASAATLSLANMRFVFQGNYFRLSPDSQPFAHQWSLSVEEQFYLLLPLFLFLLYRFIKNNRVIALAIAAAWLISFGICLYLTKTHPTWAYYVLPARAWELMTGSLLALWTVNKGTIAPKYRNLAAEIGFIVILLSIIFIRERSFFPGFIALAPVLGTAVMIGLSNGNSSIAEKVLSQRPLVFIGKISYSLYLWHWPIFSFVDYSLYASPTATRLLIKLSLTLIAALLSYFYIEQPARHYLNAPDNRLKAYGLLGCVVFTLVLSGMMIRNTFHLSAEPNSIKDGGIVFNADKKEFGSIILMGDSLASMYGTTVRDIANQLGFKLNIISANATDTLPGTQLWQDSLSVIQKERPEFLIVSANWPGKLTGRNQRDKRDRLTTLINEASEYADTIILITKPPSLPQSDTRKVIRNGTPMPFQETADSAARRKKLNLFVKSQHSAHVIVIDIESLFIDANGNIRFVDEQGKQLYQDEGHLTGVGGRLVGRLILAAITEKMESLDSTPQFPTATPRPQRMN